MMVTFVAVVVLACVIGAGVVIAKRRRAAQSHATDTSSSQESQPSVRSAMPDARNERNERNEKYASLVLGLFFRTFGSASPEALEKKEKAWNDWLKFGYLRGDPDPYALLDGTVGDEFRARALTVLIAPDLALLPFAWNVDVSGNYLPQRLRFTEFPDKLRDFAMELIPINVDFVLMTKSPDDAWYKTLLSYNSYILEALACLPESDPRAVELFDRYRISSPGHHLPGVSWYHWLKTVLQAEIPEYWKHRADEKMRNIIFAERFGRIDREEPETALDCYLTCINDFRPSYYGIGLLASQIEFALDLPKTANHRLFETWNLQRLFEFLPGDDRRMLRHRIAKHMVLGGYYCGDEYRHHFRISDEGSCAVAFGILEEFGSEDIELRDRLLTLLSEKEIKDAKAQELREQREAGRAAVLSNTE